MNDRTFTILYSGMRSGKTNKQAMLLAELAKSYTSIEIKVVSEEMKELRAENEKLLYDSKVLLALEAEGVDNWGGYNKAVERLNNGEFDE
jgi:hypothetical protein